MTLRDGSVRRPAVITGFAFSEPLCLVDATPDEIAGVTTHDGSGNQVARYTG